MNEEIEISNEEIDNLLNEIELEELDNVESIQDVITSKLPLEVRIEIDNFYKLNICLMPELKHRMKTATLTTTNPWQSWLVTYLCIRIELWLYYKTHASPETQEYTLVYLEGKHILEDLRTLQMHLLATTFEKVTKLF
jgi:hypothetical protein